MTLPGPFPIPPLLGSMAEALSEIRHMLLTYEAAMVAGPRSAETGRAVQDFDLAVQTLQDLETLARQLAAELPLTLVSQHPLTLAPLQLERSRRLFVAAILGAPPVESAARAPTIDLFGPDPAIREPQAATPSPIRRNP